MPHRAMLVDVCVPQRQEASGLEGVMRTVGRNAVTALFLLGAMTAGGLLSSASAADVRINVGIPAPVVVVPGPVVVAPAPPVVIAPGALFPLSASMTSARTPPAFPGASPSFTKKPLSDRPDPRGRPSQTCRPFVAVVGSEPRATPRRSPQPAWRGLPEMSFGRPSGRTMCAAPACTPNRAERRPRKGTADADHRPNEHE